MFDHFGFVVRDLAESLRFYEPTLASLGLRIAERQGNEAVFISGEGEVPFIWMGAPKPRFWTRSTTLPKVPSTWLSRPHRGKPSSPSTKRA
jgi:catechol 2,3-dioxygenase-like lactoylglutathione lyase family enzyme